MKRIIFYSLVLTLLACSDDPTVPATPVMEATVDGKTWTAVTNSSSVRKEGPAMFFIGVGTDGTIINIYLNPGAMGIAALNGSGFTQVPAAHMKYTSGADVYTSAYSSGAVAGEVDVIDLVTQISPADPDYGTLTGKFTANVTNLGPGEPVISISGTFAKIPFLPGTIDYSVPDVPLSLAYATVDGTRRPFALTTVTEPSGNINVTFANSTQTITLHFPISTTGLNNLGSSSTSYYATIQTGSTISESSSGQLGIQLNNFTTGRVEGIFNFSAGGVSVTDGTFGFTR